MKHRRHFELLHFLVHMLRWFLINLLFLESDKKKRNVLRFCLLNSSVFGSKIICRRNGQKISILHLSVMVVRFHELPNIFLRCSMTPLKMLSAPTHLRTWWEAYNPGFLKWALLA